MITLIRGDSLKFNFQRKDVDGEVITTQPVAMYFTVKESFRSPKAVIQKSLADMVMDVDGTYHVTITPSDTESLPYGHYVFDIEVTEPDYVQTIAKGAFFLDEEATWKENK